VQCGILLNVIKGTLHYTNLLRTYWQTFCHWPYLLRLRSSCSCWNTWRQVVSIGHSHWQHSWLHHECHCHWYPFLSYLLKMYPTMSALAWPIFYFLPLESSLLLGWLVLMWGGTIHLRKILHGGQWMARLQNGVETLSKISTGWVGCTNVIDRQ